MKNYEFLIGPPNVATHCGSLALLLGHKKKSWESEWRSSHVLTGLFLVAVLPILSLPPPLLWRCRVANCRLESSCSTPSP